MIAPLSIVRSRPLVNASRAQVFASILFFIGRSVWFIHCVSRASLSASKETAPGSFISVWQSFLRLSGVSHSKTRQVLGGTRPM